MTVDTGLRDERIAHLEMTVRYYAALSRRLERRAEAAELELEAARERLAVLGIRNYDVLSEPGEP